MDVTLLEDIWDDMGTLICRKGMTCRLMAGRSLKAGPLPDRELAVHVERACLQAPTRRIIYSPLQKKFYL